MARGITQNMVDSAADALVVAGQRPTLERIRLKLGTGAPNTIARMLDCWWKQLGQRLTAAATVDVPNAPDSVQRVLGEAWLHAWSAAKELADARVAEREAALAGREVELVAKAVSVDELERARVDQAVAAEADRAALREELAQERARASEAARALADALAAHRELQGQLRVLIEETQARDRRHQADLERAAAQETRWLREVDRERVLRKGLETDLKHVKEALEGQLARGRDLTERVRELTASLAKERQLVASRAKAVRSAPRTGGVAAVRRKSTTKPQATQPKAPVRRSGGAEKKTQTKFVARGRDATGRGAKSKTRSTSGSRARSQAAGTPRYEADDGPLTSTQLREIRQRFPQGTKRSVKTSLF